MSKSKNKDGVGPALGSAIQRLRKAYNMSLGDLSEQSGVAKSIISQIERNETNPTISTVQRLSTALDTTVDVVLKQDSKPNFIEHQSKSAIPVLESEDGLCRLSIIGALGLVEYVQWYDFHAQKGGVLASDAHQAGTVEHLYILNGWIEVKCGEEVKSARQGETIRFRGDEPHTITNIGHGEAHATMVLIMKPLGN